MGIIIAGNGEPHEVIPHFASFKGRSNYSKVKTLYYLSERHRHGIVNGVSTVGLFKATGCPLLYLRQRLPLWCEWRYLTRRLVKSHKTGRLVYAYYLSRRGKRFINERVPGDVRQACVREIVEHQQRRAADERLRSQAFISRLQQGEV